MIRFGGPVFFGDGKVPEDPVVIARRYREKGFSAAYVPKIDVNNRELVRATRKAFEDAGVMLAEAGYWENLLDTDSGTRAANRSKMMDTFVLAEEVGAACAVNILGSYCHGHGSAEHVPLNFTDEAFEAAVEIARYFIDAVKPKTASFAYEIFPFDVIDTPESIERLIKAVDRKQFGVHLDLVNLINCPRAYFASGEIARNCVRRFGDRIVSCHVKDIKLKAPSISVILEEVIMGTGNIDLKTYMRQIEGLSRPIPFMMEHLKNEAEYDTAAAFIRKTGAELGISL